MSEEPSNTKPIKRVTDKLEQLPSSKKRALNTDLLATPLTHRLDNAAPKNDDSALAPSTNPLKSVGKAEKVNNNGLTMALDSSSTGEVAKVAGTVQLTSPSTANKPLSNKETQGKNIKESPKEVVQEILKEVAKEVEKENAVKFTDLSKKSPVQTTEKIVEPKPPTIPPIPLTKHEPVVEDAKIEKNSWAEQPLESVKAVVTKSEKSKEKIEEKIEKISAIPQESDSESDSDKEMLKDKPIEMPLFNSINQFSDPVPEVKTTKAKVKSLVFWSIPLFVLLGALISIIYVVPALREKVAQKLPYNVASALRLATKQVAKVSIQEYPYSLDEKENTATIRGVVKNLSNAQIGPLELEFELTRRGDESLKEIKKVALDPVELAPEQEGKYEFVFSAKDYQVSKFSKMVSGNKIELDVKKLGLINLPPIDPSQAPTLTPLPNNKPKQPDDKIYDGTVN
ncbi:MAG: hypothetical protein HY819_10955 [Acidobacteria bacterium]|nr:hypothetical protein [Acidobacteriota bacterium]